LTNDTLNGVKVNPTDVLITSTPNGPLTVNTDGTVTVAPNTKAGNYTVDYTICQVLNPNNCSTATVTVTVVVDIIIPDLPSISILKDGTYIDNDKNGITNPGDTVLYNFVVINTGNVTLTNITITDNNAVITGGPIATLGVGAVNSTTFTAVHTITQNDINAGYVYNLATATGTTPNGGSVTATSTDPTPCTTCPIIQDCKTCTITKLAQSPTIEVVKTANSENYSAVGDILNYTIKVTNTGNVTLYQIAVTDPLTGLDIAITSLDPGKSQEYTQNYTTTQNDITNGTVKNIAYAKGVTALNTEVSASDDADVDIAIVLGCGVINIHNAFSPNGDGINEGFVIDNIDDLTCYPDNTVEIYNRWGVLVYETKNYDNVNKAFKGFSEGRTTIKQSDGLPVGTYFYILNYTSVDGTGNLVTNKKDGYLYLTR
ncbi:gliding motility-associated C-terminal domain-containing protein, partial [Flavobacterium sp. Arc2]|uniref:DUF7507 domain-containing protein n=1 Tax=Flavobacterium sp. Arc2 TaxID=3046685 RepID=UPI00352D2DB0